jgi:hypothetical protein
VNPPCPTDSHPSSTLWLAAARAKSRYIRLLLSLPPAVLSGHQPHSQCIPTCTTSPMPTLWSTAAGVRCRGKLTECSCLLLQSKLPTEPISSIHNPTIEIGVHLRRSALFFLTMHLPVCLSIASILVVSAAAYPWGTNACGPPVHGGASSTDANGPCQYHPRRRSYS